MNQFLLVIAVTANMQVQTLGPFNDREMCEDVAKQMQPLIKKYACIKLPAPPQAPKQ